MVSKVTKQVVLSMILGAAIATAICMLAGCVPLDGPTTPEGVVAAWNARTDAMLTEAGIDPAAATDEQRAEYGQKAADEMVAEYNQPWYEELGDNVLDWAKVQGGIIGLLAAGGVAFRKNNRAVENIKGILDPQVGTLKSLSALALGTHTPEETK